jgi:7-cyano-7-deazaguanine synthase in queuosine biosynthesis
MMFAVTPALTDDAASRPAVGDVDRLLQAVAKSDIAALGVPFVDTWSCYKGGAVHCGTCGTFPILQTRFRRRTLASVIR